MLNYIQSELYRTFHRKYFYLALIIAAGIGIAVNVVLGLMQASGSLNGPIDASFPLNNITGIALSFVYPCMIIVVDCVFSEEYKHQTLKNLISWGVSRPTIFFGKFITELIVALIALAAIFGCFLLSAILILGMPQQDAAVVFGLFGQRLFLALPLFFWTLAISHLFAFIIKNNTLFSFASVGVFYVLPFLNNEFFARAWVICQEIIPHLAYTRMMALAPYLETQLLPNFGSLCLEYWAAGLVRVAVCLAVGMFLFRRKEIK